MSGESIAMCGGLGCREDIYPHEARKYCTCNRGIHLCPTCEHCACCKVLLVMREHLDTKHVGVKDKDHE